MEVYLHDLGLSSEFLEIKKNKQKEINLTYQNLKLLESWIWKVSSKLYTSLYCWVPQLLAGNSITHSYLSGTGIYTTAVNKYYNFIIEAMTRTLPRFLAPCDSRQASWFLGSLVLCGSSLEGFWHPWTGFVLGTVLPCCQPLLVGSRPAISSESLVDQD